WSRPPRFALSPPQNDGVSLNPFYLLRPIEVHVKIGNCMTEKYKVPSLETLLESGLHFGHQKRRWHPKVAPYIFGLKNRAHIFDLGKTRELLAEACIFLEGVAKAGGKIIFVGTKRQAQSAIKEEALRVGAMFVNSRWLGGTMTNFESIKHKIERLRFLEEGFKSNKFEKYTKKERLLLEREQNKLETSVGGLRGLTARPDALFIVDIRREKTAVAEARRKNIPIVALVDSNNDPTQIDYPIPGNDDASLAIELTVKTIAEAVGHGYKEWAKESAVVSPQDPKKPAVKVGPAKSDKASDKEIESLKLSASSTSALTKAGIKTVGELKRLSKDDLKGIEGLSTKAVEEILLKLK
ncbi:MAG: 30S ribosomal protein S2, partial [Patescibacteria group bacterium]